MSTVRHSPSGFITATSLITAQYYEALLILNTRWQLDTGNFFLKLSGFLNTMVMRFTNLHLFGTLDFECIIKLF